jgi:hypothetical protein
VGAFPSIYPSTTSEFISDGLSEGSKGRLHSKKTRQQKSTKSILSEEKLVVI